MTSAFAPYSKLRQYGHVTPLSIPGWLRNVTRRYLSRPAFAVCLRTGDCLGRRSRRITTHYSAAESASPIEAANRVCASGTRKMPPHVLLKQGRPPQSRRAPDCLLKFWRAVRRVRRGRGHRARLQTFALCCPEHIAPTGFLRRSECRYVTGSPCRTNWPVGGRDTPCAGISSVGRRLREQTSYCPRRGIRGALRAYG